MAPSPKPPKPKARKAAATPKTIRIPGPDRAVVDLLDELLGGRAELRKGMMFGCPGYFIGTKAVASVFGNEVCMTLPPGQIEDLVRQPGFRRFEPMAGRTMSGWVLIDQERVGGFEPDDPRLDSAIAHARSKVAKPPRAGGKSSAGKATTRKTAAR
ncbi:MAG TPA: hypothetical protein VGG33_15875 [Polyangia bacterium]